MFYNGCVALWFINKKKVAHCILSFQPIVYSRCISYQAITDVTVMHRFSIRRKTSSKQLEPRILTKGLHGIQLPQISKAALEVVDVLTRARYQTYLVGGGVRDLCLEKTPKDFDIVTNATPQQVKKLFSRSYVIGRRFRLAHVHCKNERIEVSTFRAGEHRYYSKNVYGTVEEDAQRRDFTINALYYDIQQEALLDYVDGMRDLESGIIRILGKAKKRYQEDPVRMIRAIRFVAKLGFEMSPDTSEPIFKLANLLLGVSAPRLFDEVVKLFYTGHAETSYRSLQALRLLEILLPQIVYHLEHAETAFYQKFLQQSFINIDQRYKQNKSLSPSFLFAVLFWQPLQVRIAKLAGSGIPSVRALEHAIDYILAEKFTRPIDIPKRIKEGIYDIWWLQYKKHARYVRMVRRHRRFRAAYDFLLLRKQCGEQVGEQLELWAPHYK